MDERGFTCTTDLLLRIYWVHRIQRARIGGSADLILLSGIGENELNRWDRLVSVST